MPGLGRRALIGVASGIGLGLALWALVLWWFWS
jgi:hypothetical protein